MRDPVSKVRWIMTEKSVWISTSGFYMCPCSEAHPTDMCIHTYSLPTHKGSSGVLVSTCKHTHVHVHPCAEIHIHTQVHTPHMYTENNKQKKEYKEQNLKISLFFLISYVFFSLNSSFYCRKRRFSGDLAFVLIHCEESF